MYKVMIPSFLGQAQTVTSDLSPPIVGVSLFLAIFLRQEGDTPKPLQKYIFLGSLQNFAIYHLSQVWLVMMLLGQKQGVRGSVMTTKASLLINKT